MEIRFEKEFLDRHMLMIAKGQKLSSNGYISKGILSKLFLFGRLLHSYVFQDFILLLITQKVKCIPVTAYSIFIIRSASAIVLLGRFYSGNLC